MKQYPIFRFVRGILALLIVVGSFGFLFLLAYRAVPEKNRDILTLALGMVLGTMGIVVGYYFGSSKDKSDADQSRRGPAPFPQQNNQQ